MVAHQLLNWLLKALTVRRYGFSVLHEREIKPHKNWLPISPGLRRWGCPFFISESSKPAQIMPSFFGVDFYFK